MTIRNEIEERAAQLKERITTIQIAPGGFGFRQILRIAGILFISHTVIWVQSCRHNTAELRAEMARSNQAKGVLDSEGKKINAKDKAALKRLRDENRDLKSELAEARRNRETVLPASCRSCRVSGDRFPRGMRERADTNR